MTEEPVILNNVPNIRDVNVMRKMIASLGVRIEDLGGGSWRIVARTVRPADLDPELFRRIRASILLDEASVTATDNIIMATVTASGTTAIRNAASEPHIQGPLPDAEYTGSQD